MNAIPAYVLEALSPLQAPPATPDPNPLSQGFAVGLLVLYAVAVIWGLSWIFKPRPQEKEQEDQDYPPFV